MAFEHMPVMLPECLRALQVKPNGTYVDGTAGGGGHSAAIAKLLKGGRLYALDQDPSAIAVLRERLAGLPATVLQTNFRNAGPLLAEQGVSKIDGVLLDLGVSSHQLDTAERGFSYLANAPLDMRMSQQGPTAADLVNTMGRQQLADIFRQYGEEPYAWQIAGNIVAKREEQPIVTTERLAEIIRSSVPPAVRRKDKNPARK
ncbi:MAG: 16S rRNA (cytosine(1402)-N(4))-methyltransferase RsmH, partial [Oscillospiraceae bacterium]